MKKIQRKLILIVSVLFIFSAMEVPAQPTESEDRTLSPYFFVNSRDPATDRLPLKSTAASVHISGVIADVLVTQIYKNEGKKPIEAVYVFPASTRAAVYGMKMTIGKRVIEAKIKKSDEARKEYEQARDAGKNASLLEQQRPNVFQMNVANIMPGDEIRVELKYTELLVPTDKIYEFVYPAIVGPRYSNQKAAGSAPSERWVENPYLRQDELSKTTFDIQVAIHAGTPIKDLNCSSHKINAVYESAERVNVSLNQSEKHGGNRDYILRYRLDGDKIQTGLILSSNGKENFFVLMMQPPLRVTKAEIPGREYIFIVDVSGSMHGFPLDISKRLLSHLIGNLRPTDKFNVLLFSGGSTLMAETSLPATQENIRKAIAVIENQNGGGGTELLPALKRALSLKKLKNFSRSVVIVTDGYVSVEEEAFDLIRRNLGEANMFAFGIGSGVNRHIIEGMAHVGSGEPFIVTKPDVAQIQTEKFRKLIQSPVLTQVRVTFDGFNAYDVEPPTVPDVLSDRPVLVFGKWRGERKGTIKLTGFSGAGRYSQRLYVEDYQPAKNNEALKYLWARHRITILSDYNKLRNDEKRVKEVTDLGLQYNLLTAYTSFVAIDNEVRNVNGKWTTVQQPLPLPEGVSHYAVGSNAHYASAPAMYKSMSARANENKIAMMEAQASQNKDEALDTRFAVSVVDKGLTKNEVLKIAQAHQGELEKCFTGKKLSGSVKINLTINADGTVKKADIAAGDLKDAGLHQCLIDRVNKWRFPVTSNAREVKVIIVFRISS
ncbi:MAG: AgmX/PglI C-terminal domain-containing protein [Smithella sp.]|nr:AgmX/PglI C-terminal domain-containing protein [Smithella sp.]HQG64910.1 VIT domain-containing protein [Smithella sp.]